MYFLAGHGVPFGVHVTTTITGAGATCYGANVYHDDSAATKAAKKDLADKKAEGSFYHSDRTQLTVEPHSARGTESMWQVNAKSGNLCRR